MEIKIGFGIGFTSSGLAIPPSHVQRSLGLIVRRAVELFGGCNIVRGEGAWRQVDGKVVTEPSITLIIWVSQNDTDGQCTRDCESARQLAEEIRREFHQQSVLIHYSDGDLGEAEEEEHGPVAC